MVRQQEARLVEKHAFHAREGPRVRGLRTRLVAEERVDAGDGGGGRDKGHSRGRFSPRSSPPSCLFSPFFSLPERLRDHRVSRRCRFDDSEHLMGRTTPGRRPREALSPGPRNAARHATPFFSIDRVHPEFGGLAVVRTSVPSFSRSTRYTVLLPGEETRRLAFVHSTMRLSIKRCSIVHGFNRRSRFTDRLGVKHKIQRD